MGNWVSVTMETNKGNYNKQGGNGNSRNQNTLQNKSPQTEDSDSHKGLQNYCKSLGHIEAK